MCKGTQVKSVAVSVAFDLHTHSNASDGAFPPAEVIKKARAAGVESIALTDHDTVAGLHEARLAAKKEKINLINGVEFSTRWNTSSIHVVGLNIEPTNDCISSAIKNLETIREGRAIRIGEKLGKVGIKNAFENARRCATGGTITRFHFAQYIIESGHANNQNDVFKRFLVRNKPGYVSVDWPSLEQTIETICSAGGVAVIAHPLRYKMTATTLRKLIGDFKGLGGSAIEVVTGNNNQAEINLAANYAQKYDIYASIGSDFHNETTPWNQLGRLKPLPKSLKPVWELWD